VTKIHRQTGEIIWRLGGANNQFEFINDELGGFSMQHDIRAVGNNHYTIFDNGNMHKPQQSRAVEYVLDTENMTATLVWEFRGTEDNNYYTHYMGNTQRLPNGNTLINFVRGSNPKAIEVTPTGKVVYEMNFVGKFDTYRAFRFPWHGAVESPRLLMEQDLNKITLLFNKFGDKNVEYYNIYSGPEPEPTTLLDSSKVTMKTLTGLENMTRHFFRVTAVYSDGTESEYSNIVSALIKNVEPGQNMVLNGDFSLELDQWFLGLWDTDAELKVTAENECQIDITNGSDDVYAVHLVQDGMPLVKGKNYRFEFDAYADENRTILPQIVNPNGSLTNYSRTGPTALRRVKEHFSFDFTMKSPSNPDAYLVFFVGGSNVNVYIDNVSIYEVIESDVAFQASENSNPDEFELSSAYPNPFNPRTTITYHLPQGSHVKLMLYNLLGEQVQELVNQKQSAGRHAIQVDGSDLSAGVYFYEITAQASNSGKIYHSVKKIMLVK